jgi:cyclin-dependent kinase-like
VREVQLLRTLQHKNIVKLLDYRICPPEINLVFEYVERTVLQELEAHRGGLPYNVCRSLIWQLLDAAAYLHKHGVRFNFIYLTVLLPCP